MRGSDHRRHVTALWIALAVTVLWSSSWIMIRVGLDDEDLDPLTFAGLRYLTAALVLAMTVAGSAEHRTTVRGLSRSEWIRLGMLGIVFYSVTQGAQFVAIDNQPAATSSLVLSLTPLLVAIVAQRVVAEPPSARQVAGAVLVAGGAWLFFAGDLGASAVGMGAALVGLGANAASALMGRAANRRSHVPAVVVTAVSMVIGAAVLFACGVAVEGIPTLSARAGVLVLVLGVVNTAVAFTLWNHSLRELSAVESAGLNNTMLIQIALLAWIFLGENPGGLGLVGICVVTVGIALTQAGRGLAAGPAISRGGARGAVRGDVRR